MLEHFDAYAGDRGLLQRKYRIRGGYPVFYERTPERHVLHVGDLTIDVDTAADAARDLAEATLKAIDRIVSAEARKLHRPEVVYAAASEGAEAGSSGRL